MFGLGGWWGLGDVGVARNVEFTVFVVDFWDWRLTMRGTVGDSWCVDTLSLLLEVLVSDFGADIFGIGTVVVSAVLLLSGGTEDGEFGFILSFVIVNNLNLWVG